MALCGPAALRVDEALGIAFGGVRDDGDEEAASVHHGELQLLLVVRPRLQALLVDPHGYLGGAQPPDQVRHGLEIVARVADEDGAARHLARHLRQDVLLPRRAFVRGAPATGELDAEVRRVAADDLGRADHLVEEEDQRFAEVLCAIGKVGLHVVPAVVAEPTAFDDEKEEPHHPIGKGRPEQQQVARLEKEEEPLELGVVLHEPVNELEVVLLPDGEVRVGLAVAEQMVDEPAAEVLGKVDGALVVVGADVMLRIEAGAALLHGAGEKRVDGAGEVEVEVGNRSQLAQRRMRRRVESVEELRRLLIDVLAPAAVEQVLTGDAVERDRRRPVRRQLQGGGELGGERAVDGDVPPPSGPAASDSSGPTTGITCRLWISRRRSRHSSSERKLVSMSAREPASGAANRRFPDRRPRPRLGSCGGLSVVDLDSRSQPDLGGVVHKRLSLLQRIGARCDERGRSDRIS